MFSIQFPFTLTRKSESKETEVEYLRKTTSKLLKRLQSKEQIIEEIRVTVATNKVRIFKYIDQMDASINTLGFIVQLLNEELKIRKRYVLKLNKLIEAVIVDNQIKDRKLKDLFNRLKQQEKKMDYLNKTIVTLSFLLKNNYTSVKNIDIRNLFHSF